MLLGVAPISFLCCCCWDAGTVVWSNETEIYKYFIFDIPRKRKRIYRCQSRPDGCVWSFPAHVTHARIIQFALVHPSPLRWRQTGHILSQYKEITEKIHEVQYHLLCVLYNIYIYIYTPAGWCPLFRFVIIWWDDVALLLYNTIIYYLHYVYLLQNTYDVIWSYNICIGLSSILSKLKSFGRMLGKLGCE